MRVDRFRNLRHKWQFARLGEGAFVAGGVAMAISVLIQIAGLSIWWAALSFVLILIWWSIYRRIWTLENDEVSRYLGKAYPELENSSDLLFKRSDDLNLIEKLQKDRVEQAFDGLAIRIPRHLHLPLTFAIAGALALGAFTILKKDGLPRHSQNETPLIHNEQTVILSPGIDEIEITIQPPVYSRLMQTTQRLPQVEALEGSRIVWEVRFKSEVTSCAVIFSDGHRYEMNEKNQFGSSFHNNDFYRIEYTAGDSTFTSDIFPIRIIHDQNPVVNLPGVEPYQEYGFEEVNTIDVLAEITDDYGLSDAQIIATVARGAGESVKFREEKIPFDHGFKLNTNSLNLKKEIDLTALKMEPGDELYFYVLAADNKTPAPNITKSETYFVSLRDTAEVEFSVEGNLGVDLMPEYFRSQRQIIIETEKLIEDKKKIDEHRFKSKSNELGFDQKVLRLRYGQFLGEEFVSDAGDGADHHDSAEEHSDDQEGEEMLEKYMHKHDTENEHNLVEEEANPLEAYMHNHDTEEENTFFFQSVRAKLKAAMALMWESELRLRLYKPEESLPYQHKALILIKEIKNHSRIYVQRMGFDPPPLKPEASRFKGKALDEVRDSKVSNDVDADDGFANVRLLLKAIDKYKAEDKAIGLEVWQSAGNELAAKAIDEPDHYFKPLQLVHRFREARVPEANLENELGSLYEMLSEALPLEKKSILSSLHSKWDVRLFEQLNQLP